MADFGVLVSLRYGMMRLPDWPPLARLWVPRYVLGNGYGAEYAWHSARFISPLEGRAELRCNPFHEEEMCREDWKSVGQPLDPWVP